MRSFRVLICLLFAVPALAETFVFRNVTVIPMNLPHVLENQSVVVRDGRIVAVSKTAPVPKDANVIDGTGKFLIPGLADMHGHIPAPDAKGDLMNDTLVMFLASGVTTVRGMFGQPGHLEIREKVKNGDIAGPTLYLAGPIFSNTTVASPAEAAARVRKQKKEGWDLLKVHSGLTREQYDAMAKTAREEGIRFGGHVPNAVGLMHAIEMGQETFEHLEGYLEFDTKKGRIDDTKISGFVKKSKEAGVWVVPTNAVLEVIYGATPIETLKAYPELRYSPAAAIDSWAKEYDTRLKQIPRTVATDVIQNRRRVLNALHSAGVKILFGTDALQQFTLPGFSVVHEMQSMRAAGLSPLEILRTATVNPGEYFAKQDSFGTIEPGRRADLVLLDASPLADVANITKVSGVMAHGRWYPRDQLDTALRRVMDKYRKPGEVPEAR